MSKKIELSRDEAKLVFGGVQVGSNSDDDNINEAQYCSCTYVNKSAGVTNSNSGNCICDCIAGVSAAYM
jgi:hypothetical protein